MLVSMECLIGAAYTRKVQAAGLAGAIRPSMGRVDARFADWRIGVASHWAQLWVDRNFALDYTLKSLEKVLDGPPRHAVRQARAVLKDAAYTVLGEMIAAIEAQPLAAPPAARSGCRRRSAPCWTRRSSCCAPAWTPPCGRLPPASRPGIVRMLHDEYRAVGCRGRVAADQRGRSLWHLTALAGPVRRWPSPGSAPS